LIVVRKTVFACLRNVGSCLGVYSSASFRQYTSANGVFSLSVSAFIDLS